MFTLDPVSAILRIKKWAGPYDAINLVDWGRNGKEIQAAMWRRRSFKIAPKDSQEM